MAPPLNLNFPVDEEDSEWMLNEQGLSAAHLSQVQKAAAMASIFQELYPTTAGDNLSE